MRYLILDAAMLDDLDQVRWKDLKHAQGSARDVPKHLKFLADPDPGTREEAYWLLSGNIISQGYRFEAAPFAIPFIYEMLESPETLGRAELVYFLVSLALGHEDEFLPRGLNANEYRDRLSQSNENLSDEQRVHCKTIGIGPQVDLDCFQAVNDGIPLLISLLNESEEELRQAIAYTLGWFSDHANESMPALYRMLENKDETTVGHSLLSLGLLARNSESKLDDDAIRPFLFGDRLALKVCAAIASAPDPLDPNSMSMLADVLKENAQELEEQASEIRFNDYMLAGYVGKVVSVFGNDFKDSVVEALCHAMPNVDATQAFNLTSSLLLMLFEKQLDGSGEPPASLDSTQVDALRGIVENGIWDTEEEMGNSGDLLELFGLPSSRKELSGFIDEIESPA